MKISKDEIIHVANLARLEMSAGEVEEMAVQLDSILSYVDKLNELDTSGVKPASHAIDVCNAFREDEVKESLGQEQSLANGPSHNGEAFVVPMVI